MRPFSPGGREGFVYLAGPYRGEDAISHDWRWFETIDRHIASARSWAMRCANDALPYFCPHLNSAHFEVLCPQVPASFWLAMDLEILKGATALLLLPGWRKSAGAILERAAAHEQGIRVFTHNQYDALKEWWEKGEEIRWK